MQIMWHTWFQPKPITISILHSIKAIPWILLFTAFKIVGAMWVGQVLVKEFHTYTINCTSYTKVRIFANCNKNADGQHVCRISWYIIVSLHQVMDRSHTSYHTPDVNQFCIRTSIVHCLGARLGTVSLTTFRLVIKISLFACFELVLAQVIKCISVVPVVFLFCYTQCHCIQSKQYNWQSNGICFTEINHSVWLPPRARLHIKMSYYYRDSNYRNE